jgi:hypothetical protein
MLLKCEKLSLEVEMELTGSKESSKKCFVVSQGRHFLFCLGECFLWNGKLL